MEKWSHAERQDSLSLGTSTQVWPVHDSYQVNGGFIKPSDSSRRHLYFPMAHPELAFRLAEIAGAEDEKVLEFVQTWGGLGYDHIKRNRVEDGRGDPIEFILDHAQRVKETFDLLEKITIPDGVPLESAKPHYSGPTLWPLVPSQVPLDGISLKLRVMNKQPLSYEQAPELLLDQPHSEEEAAELALGTPEPPEVLRLHAEQGSSISLDPVGVRLEVHWRAMLDVVYWHLASYASGERGWGRCQECGDFFNRTDPRRRFCPPPEGLYARSQSLCGLRYRARLSRQKRSRRES